jgi:glycosyltransferase involved in cell wall biosynthesis
MKVSIIIPTYNAQKTIRKAVNSALKQNFPKKEFEIIVINDGSTDNTLNVLKSYGTRIKLINNHKNIGAVKAANKGFKKSQGKYLIKLDSDDVFKSSIIKEMARVLDEKPQVNFVYSDYYENTLDKKINFVLTGNNIFNTVSVGVMYRRKEFKKFGFYNANVIFPEYDLLLRTQGKWFGHHIGKCLFYYNRSSASLTGKKELVDRGISQLRTLYSRKNWQIRKIRKY